MAAVVGRIVALVVMSVHVGGDVVVAGEEIDKFFCVPEIVRVVRGKDGVVVEEDGPLILCLGGIEFTFEPCQLSGGHGCVPRCGLAALFGPELLQEFCGHLCSRVIRRLSKSADFGAVEGDGPPTFMDLAFVRFLHPEGGENLGLVCIGDVEVVVPRNKATRSTELIVKGHDLCEAGEVGIDDVAKSDDEIERKLVQFLDGAFQLSEGVSVEAGAPRVLVGVLGVGDDSEGEFGSVGGCGGGRSTECQGQGAFEEISPVHGLRLSRGFCRIEANDFGISMGRWGCPNTSDLRN